MLTQLSAGQLGQRSCAYIQQVARHALLGVFHKLRSALLGHLPGPGNPVLHRGAERLCLVPCLGGAGLDEVPAAGEPVFQGFQVLFGLHGPGGGGDGGGGQAGARGHALPGGGHGPLPVRPGLHGRAVQEAGAGHLPPGLADHVGQLVAQQGLTAGGGQVQPPGGEGDPAALGDGLGAGVGHRLAFVKLDGREVSAEGVLHFGPDGSGQVHRPGVLLSAPAFGQLLQRLIARHHRVPSGGDGSGAGRRVASAVCLDVFHGLHLMFRFG